MPTNFQKPDVVYKTLQSLQVEKFTPYSDKLSCVRKGAVCALVSLSLVHGQLKVSGYLGKVFSLCLVLVSTAL